MLTIYPDKPSHRRNRVHLILDENDDLVWSARSMMGALRWVYAEGHTVVRVTGPEGEWPESIHIALSHVPRAAEPIPISTSL